MTNPNTWTSNATEAGVASCNPDKLNENLEYLKYEADNLNTDSAEFKGQCITSFNGSTDTVSIFDVSCANLTGNLLKAGIKFNTVIDGLKHRYYLTQDVSIPAFETNKLYFPVLKVKDAAKYKRELLSSDVDIILLNQEMLWKIPASIVNNLVNNVVMTSDNTNGYVTTSSAVYGTYYAYKACNGVLSGDEGFVSSAPSPYWQLQLPNAATFNRVRIYGSGNNMIKDFVIKLSLDGVTYPYTKVVTGQTNWNSGFNDYDILKGSYKYVRIEISANNGGNVTSLNEVRLYNDVPTMLIPSSLELQTDGSTITDKWGNTVTVQGNPTISNGNLVCDGSGDFLKISSVTNLGTDKWIIQTAYTFTNTNTDDYILCSKANSGLRGFLEIVRTSANKLKLNMSDSATGAWIGAADTLGTKTNWVAGTKYYYRLRCTGTQYLLEWSTDGIAWTADITITSALKLTTGLTYLLFGVKYDEVTASHNGTISIADTKIFAGNDYIQGSGRFYYNGENVYIGYPSSYISANAVPAIMLGELTTNGTQVSNAITYAFNRRFLSSAITPSGSTRLSAVHGLGITPKHSECSVFLVNKIPEGGYVAGDKLGQFGSYVASYYNCGSGVTVNNKEVSFTTGNSGGGIIATNKTTGGSTTITPANWDVYLEVNGE